MVFFRDRYTGGRESPMFPAARVVKSPRENETPRERSEGGGQLRSDFCDERAALLYRVKLIASTYLQLTVYKMLLPRGQFNLSAR